MTIPECYLQAMRDRRQFCWLNPAHESAAKWILRKVWK